MSMAAGEYVSVSSQSDTEKADLDRERTELADQPEQELKELAAIFEARGVQSETAWQVARQVTTHDVLGAHAREELGITDLNAARPLQAAMTSALTFAIGALLPLLIVLLSPPEVLLYTVPASTLIFLALLGAAGARAGGADVSRATVRVAFWGAVAMAMTAIVGLMFGAVAV